VVLVHGLSFSHQEWSELGPTLAEQGWYAIAPDLLALCDALRLPRVHLIGHSLGAQISYFLAAIHPRRLLRLVLVDAGGRVPADALQIIGPSLQRLGRVYHPTPPLVPTGRGTHISRFACQTSSGVPGYLLKTHLAAEQFGFSGLKLVFRERSRLFELRQPL